MTELTESTIRRLYYGTIRPHLPPSKPSIFVVTCLTWMCCILSISRCTFFVQQSLTSTDQQDLEMGLFSRSVYDKDGDHLGCVSYTDHGGDFIDDMFKIGRAFGIIAALCTSIVAIFVSTSLLFSPKGCEVLWSAAGFYSAAGTVGQVFAFFVFNSQHCQSNEHSCRLSGIGRLAVVNTLFMAGLSVKLFLEEAPRLPWLGWYNDIVEDDTLATNQSPHQASKKKETLNIVDPFTAEFVSSQQQDNQEEKQEVMMEENEHQNARKHKSTGASVTSDGTGISQQSLQESMASTLGVQSVRSFRILMMTLVTIAWAVSVIGVHHCTFMLVGPSAGERGDFSGLGLFSRAAYYKGDLIGCLAYPDETTSRFDQPFQAARTFGVITSLLMSIIFILAILQLFVKLAKDEIWLVIRVLLPCATISQLLVFFGYKTETCTMTELIDCRMGGTGIVVILNICLMILLTVVTLIVPPPPSPLICFHPRSNSSSEGSQNHPRQRQDDVAKHPKRNDNETTPSSGNNAQVLPSYPSPVRPAHQFRTQMQSIPEAPSVEIDDSFSLPESGADPSNHSSRAGAPPAPSAAAPVPPGTLPMAAAQRKPVRMGDNDEEGLYPPAAHTTITVQVEYNGKEKKTVKTLTHPDGSRTITTTIEELGDEYEVGDDEEFSLVEEEMSHYHNKQQENAEGSSLGQLEQVSLDDNEEEEEPTLPDPTEPLPVQDENPVEGTVRNLRQMFEKNS